MCELNPSLRIDVASWYFIDSKEYVRLKEGLWIDDTVIESFFKAIATKSTHIHNNRCTILGGLLCKYVKKESYPGFQVRFVDCHSIIWTIS